MKKSGITSFLANEYKVTEKKNYAKFQKKYNKHPKDMNREGK
jgi:hypothetical protein